MTALGQVGLPITETTAGFRAQPLKPTHDGTRPTYRVREADLGAFMRRYMRDLR